MLLLAAAFGAALVLVQWSARSRVRALCRARKGVCEEGFTEYLRSFGFDPAIASATYRYLRDAQCIPFPILPGDLLYEDLRLDEETLEETLRDLAAILERDLLPGLRPQPLFTVDDLLRLLQASPRRTEKAAA
jgi:hypothetical protein